MKKVMDGNNVCGNIAHFMSELSFIYPITPSSPMASTVSHLCELKTKNLFNEETSVIEMQSEAGVSGAMHGALLNGTLTSSFTSSQGLLLMIPNLYKMAGEGLPGVIHVAARTVATNALSIFGDHSDIYACINTGTCMLASSNIKDINYLSYIAHMSSIEGSLPFIHFFDGFRTSHELNTIDFKDSGEFLDLINFDAIKNFKNKALTRNSNTRGMNMNEDLYFTLQEARNKEYQDIIDIVINNMHKVNDKFNTNYEPFMYYGDKEATDVIVAMGSVNDTIKLVIDEQNKLGNHLGLVTVHLFRPFSSNYLKKVLPSTVKNICVLDRAKNAGSTGETLYLDVLSSLTDTNIKVIGGRFGLSSKNTTPAMIKAVYDNLQTKQLNNFSVGINDDLTNLSLEVPNYSLNLNCDEIKIYGYGSDGMITASKDLLKLIGEHSDKYSQGYFEYDSKKSGGLTKSHLRFSDKPINAPYYVTNVKLAVITKDSYLVKYHLFDELNNNGIVIINTNKKLEELVINEYNQKMFNEKNLKILLIDASKIASDNHITGKISMIMETIILKVLGYDNLINELVNNIKIKFKTKGDDIINNNINALNSIKNLQVINNYQFKTSLKEEANIFNIINNGLGNNLSVSEIYDLRHGEFKNNQSKLDYKNTTDLVPNWDSSKCIQCNLCTTICPHAVLRPIENEKTGVPSKTNPDTKYYLSINEEMCTSCGLCSEICPTKAISMGNKQGNTYLEESPKYLGMTNNIKELQYNSPLFKYSSACSGCGEINYLKTLSQIAGPGLVILNATGCSSIYGGNIPATPYSIPWANSLFEDNAEFALGVKKSIDTNKKHLINIINTILESVTKETKELLEEYLANQDDYLKVNNIIDKLQTSDIPNELKEHLTDLLPRTVFAVGGDGWAYDIGFSGIDQVLSSNLDINILVLDTETYSNTGGQASKATRRGAVAEFADTGKNTNKKDMFKIAMTYPNVYVAETSFLANPAHTVKVMNEAIRHHGPSIILSYATCIEQGICDGLKNSISEQKLLVNSGYNILMHYEDGKLTIDSPKPNYDLLKDVFNNEVRYKALKIKNPDSKLQEELINNIKERYEYYQRISEE